MRASVCAFVVCQREWECLCLCLWWGWGGGLGGVVVLVRGGSAGLRCRRATRYFQGRATQEVSLARPPLPHWLDLLRQNSRALRPPTLQLSNPPIAPVIVPRARPPDPSISWKKSRRFARACRRPWLCRPSNSQSVSPAASSHQPSTLTLPPPSPCRDVAPLDLSLRRWLGITRSHSGSSPEWKNPGA